MDNKQAAEALRTIIDHVGVPAWHEAAERGADAIEMLEWLLTPPDKTYRLRVWKLHQDWDGGGEFKDYCEARFRENKKGLAQNG